MLSNLKATLTLDFETVDFPYYATILEDMAAAWEITGKEPLEWEPNPDPSLHHIPRLNIDRSTIAMQHIFYVDPIISVFIFFFVFLLF